MISRFPLIQPSAAAKTLSTIASACTQPTVRLSTVRYTSLPLLTTSRTLVTMQRCVPMTQSTSILSRFSCNVATKLSVRPFSSTILRMNAERAQDHSALTWNEFLKYRTYRRGFQVASMGVSGLVGLVVGWEYISSVNIDPTQMVFGFDPLLAMGAGLFMFTGFCALLGPLLGNFVFNFLVLRSKRLPFRLKEDLFLQHVKKNRVDPSYQSFANPVPDYYGEKITSLHGYRRWLRNCAAYRKKRDEFLKM